MDARKLTDKSEFSKTYKNEYRYYNQRTVGQTCSTVRSFLSILIAVRAIGLLEKIVDADIIKL